MAEPGDSIPFRSALVDDGNGNERHDVAALVRAMQTKFPGDSRRNARAAARILGMTREICPIVREHIVEASVQWFGPSEEIRDRILLELDGLVGRLDLYEHTIRGLRPSDDIPESVYPLVFRVTREGGQMPFSTPEWLAPFMLDNQVRALVAHRRAIQGVFGDLMAETVALVRTTRETLESVPDMAKPVAEALKESAQYIAISVAAVGIGAFVLGRRFR